MPEFPPCGRHVSARVRKSLCPLRADELRDTPERKRFEEKAIFAGVMAHLRCAEKHDDAAGVPALRGSDDLQAGRALAAVELQVGHHRIVRSERGQMHRR